VKLRAQLLLAAFALTLVPLAGWQAAGQFERALRADYATGVLDTTIALARRAALELPESWPGDPESSLIVRPLDQPLYIDGYLDDWPQPTRLANAAPAAAVDVQVGEDQTGLYLAIAIDSPQQVFAVAPELLGDEIELTLTHPDGRRAKLELHPLAPGWIETHGETADRWPSVQGVWQSRSQGWTVELIVPDRVRPVALALRVTDRDRPGQEPPPRQWSIGQPALALLRPSSALKRLLTQASPTGSTAWAILPDGRVVNRATSEAKSGRMTSAGNPSWSGTWLFERLAADRLTPRPSHSAHNARLFGAEIGRSEPVIHWSTRLDGPGIDLAAAAPVRIAGKMVGQVVVQRDADHLLMQANQALARLLSMTFGAALIVALILLGFATVLSERIRRLRNTAEAAVARDGSVLQLPTPSKAGDEVGDLDRSLVALLDRLAGQQHYLRTLAEKLAHELRTPLAMIESSLDNLEHDCNAAQSERYCRRARQGSQRLNRILRAMSQAAQIEESLKTEARSGFSLSALLHDYCQACRETYPAIEWRVDLGNRSIMLLGSPDLFAQLLDKLIDNAVDFTAEGGWIRIRLRAHGDRANLDIENQGPGMPPELLANVFGSMVAKRAKRGPGVHLGLGLYIARLITEYHGGTIAAQNTPRGCRLLLDFPESSDQLSPGRSFRQALT